MTFEDLVTYHLEYYFDDTEGGLAADISALGLKKGGDVYILWRSTTTA